eukprot:8176563-Pyramimonas_sp.AAC.2
MQTLRLLRRRGVMYDGAASTGYKRRPAIVNAPERERRTRALLFRERVLSGPGAGGGRCATARRVRACSATTGTARARSTRCARARRATL